MIERSSGDETWGVGAHWAAAALGSIPGTTAVSLPRAGGEQGGTQGQGRVVAYLLMDVARAPLLALLPAQQLAPLQEPIPGTACPGPGHAWVQLLEEGTVPKVLRAPNPTAGELKGKGRAMEVLPTSGGIAHSSAPALSWGLPLQGAQPLLAAHRDHESVPGPGEDLSSLIPLVAAPQLSQEHLWLHLQSGARAELGARLPVPGAVPGAGPVPSSSAPGREQPPAAA